MNRKPLLGTLAGLALLSASLAPDRAPRLLYNRSASAPVAWYALKPSQHFDVGDLVAASLHEEAGVLATERGYLPPGIPVIKTIWAREGDQYCILGGALSVAGKPSLLIQPFDSQNRAMPVLAGGCRRVADGNILLASVHSAQSFDSRYFGEVPAHLVLGRATYIGQFEEFWRGKNGQKGGTRGQGAQGKIKGGRAARGVTPCLHIIISRAIFWAVELRIAEYSANTRLKRSSVSYLAQKPSSADRA
ncbi:MAG: S26 family signal peptidase [Pseudomonadota bacterium]